MPKSIIDRRDATFKEHRHFTLFHICFANHSEVLFRKEVDYIAFINIIATEADKQDVAVRVFACMSDHVHLAVAAKNIDLFTSNIIYRYSKYFNHAYCRKGTLIKEDIYARCVFGRYHELAVYSYIIRNPRHHDVCESSLGYAYSSGKYYFDAAFGRERPQMFVPRSKAILSHRVDFPKTWRVLPSGMINPYDWLDIRNVEYDYGTFKNFSYNISHRKSNEDWVREQQEDTKRPNAGTDMDEVTLEYIEPFFRSDIKQMKDTEVFSFKENGRSDLQVCSIIDNCIIRRFDVRSVYELTDEQKLLCRRILKREYSVFNELQISRCVPII